MCVCRVRLTEIREIGIFFGFWGGFEIRPEIARKSAYGSRRRGAGVKPSKAWYDIFRVLGDGMRMVTAFTREVMAVPVQDTMTSVSIVQRGVVCQILGVSRALCQILPKMPVKVRPPLGAHRASVKTQTAGGVLITGCA